MLLSSNIFKHKLFHLLGCLITLSIGLNTTSCKSSSSGKSKTSAKEFKQNAKENNLDALDPRAKEAVETAIAFIGTRYKYGGTDKKGVDCSGLIFTSYKNAGLNDIPRTSNTQFNYGKRIYIGELQVGDLVFFGGKPGGKKITHVGIVSYSVEGRVKFIHASSKRGVVEDEMTKDYWTPRYIRATRPTS